MRKFSGFLPIIIAVIVSVFACDFQLPEKIEIRGTPSVRFAATMNLSDMFFDMIKDSLESDDANILQCTQTENETLIIHVDLISDDDSNGKVSESELALDPHPSILDHYKLDADKTLIPLESVTMDLSGMVGDFLEGFDFREVKAKLYISGSDFTEYILVVFGTDEKKVNVYGADSGVSGFNAGWTNRSSFTALPNHGAEIDLTDIMNSGGNISFDYTVILLANDKIPIAALTGDQYIRAELVIWLPLEFVAGSGGGDITIPELFSDGDDLFGRDAESSGDMVTDIFESMRIKIEMNKSPFTGGTLVVKSGTIEIPAPLNGNSLDFGLNEEYMEKINDPANIPFAPEFTIHFAQGGTLGIPRNFMTTALYFEVKMKYTYDLAGE